MTLLKSILRVFIGIGIFEWGYHYIEIQKGIGNPWITFFIGLCVWITFYFLLDVAENLN